MGFVGDEEMRDGYLSNEDMKEACVRKAMELFDLCDLEKKGYLSRSDLFRLQSELPLSKEALSDVFDSLDNDGDSFLTLEEFAGGFGSFLGIANEKPERKLSECLYVPQNFTNEYSDDDEEDNMNFDSLLSGIGAKEVFDDTTVIKSLWNRIKKDEPELLTSFEDFLSRVTMEIQKSHTDLSSLEHAFASKNISHDTEVAKLYDEMEMQLRQEKERIIAEEQTKEKVKRETIQKLLSEKDQELEETRKKHQELSSKMMNLTMNESETKQENEKLENEKYEIINKLKDTQRKLADSQKYIDKMQKQFKEEKRERARNALQITEGIALERESLVEQLILLKRVNENLRDKRDAQMNQRGGLYGYSFSSDEGDILDEYDDEEIDNDSESNGYSKKKLKKKKSLRSEKLSKNTLTKQGSIMADYMNDPAENIDEEEYEEDLDPIVTSNLESMNSLLSNTYVTIEENNVNHKPPSSQNIATSKESKNVTPERMFKIVIIGDSGVGKSSFIHRFCEGSFNPTFSATIGVDFRVKTITIDGHCIALQIWDTAGQERFRSITKQYFRKADGVIVMYDVMSELTFINVREWVNSAKQSIDENAVVMVLGNKMDLCGDENDKKVKSKVASKFCENEQTLFYEVSAYSGTYVADAVNAMASLLRQKEDNDIKDALTLSKCGKKKGCCS